MIADALVAISGMAGALKSASEITKALLETSDAATIRPKVIELNGKIMAAQQSALSAQRDQFTLLDRIRDLEKELANVEAWNAEKQRYSLQRVDRGSVAYVLKESMSNGEPPHWLCARCYAEGKKSFLQVLPGLRTGPWSQEQRWFCSACSSGIQAAYTTEPAYAPILENKNDGQ